MRRVPKPVSGKPWTAGLVGFFDAADNGGIGAVFVGLHGGKRRFGLLGGTMQTILPSLATWNTS